MAILKDFEVRVVSKSTGKPLQEYDSPETTAVDHYTIEKFIEATTGEDFAVEVFIKEGYSCHRAWGVWVGINIDGGVVDFGHPICRSVVKERQPAGKRLTIFDSVSHSEGSVHSRIGFRFGSLTIDESIDTTQEDLNTQAATLGTITIAVERVNRKVLSSPRLAPAFYRPPESFSAAKELIKNKHVGSVMHASPIARHQVEQDPPATPSATAEGEASSNTLLAKPEIEVEGMADSTTAIVPQIPVPSPDDEEIAKKFERLEKQLKESQEQLRASRESQDKTNALMQSVMGGFSTIFQAVAGQTTTAPAAFPAPQLPVVKRERVKEEEDTRTGNSTGGRARSGSRPTKRTKTVIELD
ncbi:MAG: hypothetical protein Q9186_001103 [Xanthomendoza sp. 1 TL-2023]